MGSFYSQPNQPDQRDKISNVSKLFNINNETEFLESLKLSDFHVNNNKKLPLPIIGGKPEEPQMQKFNFETDFDIDFNLVGGSGKDPRFIARRQRYLRHNIFKILKSLDNNNTEGQLGGFDINKVEGKEEDGNNLSISDSANQNIKDIILNEVHKLKTQQQGGAGCSCEGEKQTGGKSAKAGKPAKGKNTRRRNNKQESSSSSTTDNESSLNGGGSSSSSSSSGSSSGSESSSESSADSNSENGLSSNSDSQKGGLSIFPFNSSDIKSSVSEKKNMRMIRRKI